MTNPQLSETKVMNILDTLYDKAINGVPGTPNCHELASEYLEKYPDTEKAVNKFVHWQIAKCTTSGFLTSLGGLITLPVAIPANLTTVWYVQLRMIATIAIMAGYNPSDDEVRTLAYVCLTGSSMAKACREAGVNFANKLVMAQIKKIPGEVLRKINKKIGFLFVTKAGQTGIINLTKMVPIAGGVVGGGFDFVNTKAIAKRTYKVFVLEDLD